MTTLFFPVYTNEASAEDLRAIDKSPFTEQQLAEFDEESRASFCQQQAYLEAHPPIGICRWATTGSQTRDGGVIRQATLPLKVILACGQDVYFAQVGDCVVYSDGSTAQIMTGAGRGNSSVALVGSLLSNGDQIINTPQEAVLCVLRDGVPMPEDFLPTLPSIEGMSHA